MLFDKNHDKNYLHSEFKISVTKISLNKIELFKSRTPTVLDK